MIYEIKWIPDDEGDYMADGSDDQEYEEDQEVPF